MRAVRIPGEALRFLDCSEQRYLDASVPRRSWSLDLQLLDPAEAAAIREFFVAMRGMSGVFDFEDPWTGLVVSGCRFAEDSLSLAVEGELDLRTSVTIWGP